MQSTPLGTLPSQPKLHSSKWTQHHLRDCPQIVVAFSGLLHSASALGPSLLNIHELSEIEANEKKLITNSNNS